MRLRSKIFLGYTAAVVLLIGALGWSVAALSRLATATEAILQENYRSILAAENMVGSLERQDSGLLLLLLGVEDQGEQEYREGQIDFLQWLGRAKDNITLEGEAAIIAALETDYARFLSESTTLGRARAADPGAATTFYQERVRPLFWRIRDEAVVLRELNQSAMVDASARAESIGGRAILWTLVFGSVIAVAGLLISALLSRRLVQPLVALSAAAEQIARGKYDVELPAVSGDEMGQLADRFGVMAGKLAEFHQLNVSEILAEKKRSDAIIRSINDGIVLLDNEFRVVSINPKAEQILSVDRDTAKRRPVAEFLNDEVLFNRIRDIAMSGRTRRAGAEDLVLSIPSGEETQHYELDITEVRADGRGSLGFVLAIEDITKFRELDRLKTEFVATASHELRTPLTSMAMSLDLLQESVGSSLEQRDREMLDVAREDVQRMRALVDELLDLSRVESRQLAIELEEVDAAALVESILATFRPQAEKAGIELEVELPADLPAMRADRTKIGWVLANLISNALRHTPEGGHILVAVDAVRDFVQLSVSDDGVGIPFEMQGRIFGKFVQVPGERAAGGTGLGLAIAKGIVNAHGGTIWVDSTPGRGSTFTFLIPALNPSPATAGGTTIHGGEENPGRR
jgi:NtrC-family two-component system sensor histidine kinase KinB